jgi:hypothetical protein
MPKHTITVLINGGAIEYSSSDPGFSLKKELQTQRGEIVEWRSEYPFAIVFETTYPGSKKSLGKTLRSDSDVMATSGWHKFSTVVYDGSTGEMLVDDPRIFVN